MGEMPDISSMINMLNDKGIDINSIVNSLNNSNSSSNNTSTNSFSRKW